MKNILYITSAFYPETQISAIRNSKIAKYLAKEGYKVTVISPEFEKNYENIVEINIEDRAKIINYRVPHSKQYVKTFLKSRNQYLDQNYKKNNSDSSKVKSNSKLKTIIYSNTQEIFTIFQAWDWKNQVINSINQNFNSKNFDVVITSYPRLATILVGNYVKKENIAKKWVLDFRDPMAYGNLNSKWYSALYSNLQQKYCNLADIVLHVSKDMKFVLQKGVKDNSKFYYLPNGFDNDDKNLITNSNFKVNSNKKITFSYVGSLYKGKRDIRILFKNLRSLIDRNKIKEGEIEFLYAGKEFSVLHQQAREYSLDGLLVNCGLVSKGDSLSIQSQSDIIIVTTWNTESDKGVIPGKIYECFLLKRPIVAIINGDTPNSELGKMVKTSGLGIEIETMNESDQQEELLSEFILQVYNGNNSVTNYNESYVESFNYKNITKELSEILSTKL